MLITEAADDDEISFLYETQASDNNKGKNKVIEIDDDEDEIQLLFATNWNRRKRKRKAFIDDDVLVLATSSLIKGVQETIVEEDQFKLKKEHVVHLNNPLHFHDDELQVIYSFPAQFSNSKHHNHENDHLSGNVHADDLSLLIMCELCADEKKKGEFLTVMGCDHSYCFGCVARYVASKLQQNVVEITCPVSKCEGVLGPEHCRPVLPSQVYDRWGTALCEDIISPNQKFYCPYIDCSALMIDDTQETGELIMQMECPNCQRMFCVKCRVPWHKGVECEDFQMLNENERGKEDIMLVNLAKKNLWKRCPRCKMYVQRSQGCNTMRCRCGCSFCYACGVAYPNCLCMQGYAHQFPIRGHPYAINQTLHLPPLSSIPTIQNANNPPIQFRQGPVEDHSNASLRARPIAQRQLLRHRLLNLSANQTHSDPSVQFLQGHVGGRGEGHRSIPNARQLERLSMMNGLQNQLANKAQSNPSSQFLQSPVGDRDNTPNVHQGPVGGRDNTPNASQDPVGGRGSTPNASQFEWMRLSMMNGLQNLLANETQSNPSSRFQKDPVGARAKTPNVRQLELMQLQIMNDLRKPSANQTRPYTPLFARVAHTNKFSQASQSLPRTSHVDPMENLSANHTQSYTNMPPLGASVGHANEFIQPSWSPPGTSHVDLVDNLSANQTRAHLGASVARINEVTQSSRSLPKTSHVEPVENLSISQSQLSGISFASNHVCKRRQV